MSGSRTRISRRARRGFRLLALFGVVLVCGVLASLAGATLGAPHLSSPRGGLAAPAAETPDPEIERAIRQYESGRAGEALPIFQLHREDPWAGYYLADHAWRERNDAATALAEWQRLIQAFPDSPVATLSRRALIGLAVTRRDWAAAARLGAEELQRHPHSFRAERLRLVWAEALLRLGRLEEARRCLLAPVAGGGPWALARGRALARLALHCGRPDPEAERLLESGLAEGAAAGEPFVEVRSRAWATLELGRLKLLAARAAPDGLQPGAGKKTAAFQLWEQLAAGSGEPARLARLELAAAAHLRQPAGARDMLEIAGALEQLGRFAEAAQWYEDARQRGGLASAGEIPAREGELRCLVAQGRHEPACRLAKALLEKYPQGEHVARTRLSLGRSYERLGEGNRAQAEYQRAAQMGGQTAAAQQAWTELVRWRLHRQGPHAAAETAAAFAQTVPQSPALGAAWRLVAEAYCKRGWLSSAIGCYHQSLLAENSGPAAVKATLHLAECLDQRNRPAEAVQRLLGLLAYGRADRLYPRIVAPGTWEKDALAGAARDEVRLKIAQLLRTASGRGGERTWAELARRWREAVLSDGSAAARARAEALSP